MNELDRMLRRTIETRGGAPLVTWYDGDTGERVELSGVTTENWVSKTANLLAEEFGVDEGSEVAVTLPPHWQTIVVELAVWRQGACLVVPGSDADVADVTLHVSDEAGLRTPVTRPTLGLSLAPMARGLSSPVPGVVDYAAEVSGYGDHAFTVDVDAGQPAVLRGPEERSYSGVAAAVTAFGADHGLGQGERVLVDLDTADLAPEFLPAPLLLGCSVVLVRGRADRDRIAGDERVTRTLAA